MNTNQPAPDIISGSGITSPRISLLSWSICVVFIATRGFLIASPELRHSTIGLYVTYGFESVSGRDQGSSIYDTHKANVKKRQQIAGQTMERGADTVEYPPLAISMMEIPVRILGLTASQEEGISQYQANRYIRAARVGFAISDGVGFALMFYILRSKLNASPIRIFKALCLYTFCGLTLYAVLYDRMDIIMSTLMLGSLAALLSSLPYVFSFVLLATAINFKIVAILLAPVMIIGSLPCCSFSDTRINQLKLLCGRVLMLLFITFLIFVPYILRDGISSFGFLKYHMARGIQLESLPANIVLLLHLFGRSVKIDHSFGSTNIVAYGAQWIALAGTVFTIVAEFLMCCQLWRVCQRKLAHSSDQISLRHAYPQMIMHFSALALAIGICGSKVFSPQYMVWFIALVPLVIIESKDKDNSMLTIFLYTCFLTMLIYPVLFDSEVRPVAPLHGSALGFLPPTLFGLALLTARNVLFAAITVILARTCPRQSAA
jgi:hypothetical protein